MDGLLFDHTMLPVEAALQPRRDRTRGRRRNERRRPARPATQWPLDGAINVVLFAGAGGACQGLEEAGFPVHIAVNHDKVAIAAHRALNPHTKHLQADIYEVCPLNATDGREVNILWLSPDCRDHSVAKGGAPRSPRVRSMPWQGCRWVGKLRKRGRGPAVVYLENVREIRGWGPLIAKRDPATGRVLKRVEVPDPKKPGKMKEVPVVAEKGERVPVQQQYLVRDPKRLGKTYRRWVRHMQGLGVRYEDRDLNCAEHGVPTGRKRLFGVGVFSDAHPIMWPQKTHAPRGSDLVLSGQRLPFRMAAEIINWTLPLPSIFDRKKELAPATRKRIAVGMKRFVIEAEQPFLIHLTHHGERPEIDPAEPFPTITGAHRGEMAVVGPMVVPTTHTGPRVHDGTEPLRTLTAGVKGGEFAVVGVEVRPSGGDWRYDQRDVTSSHTDMDVATAVATIIGAGGRAAQSPPMGMDDPLNTSTTKEDRCLVAATLVGVAHGDDARSGSRTYDIKDALRTATGSNDQAVIAAHLTRYHGERRPGEARGIDPADPLATQTTENRFGVVAAHLTKFQENSVGQAPQEPIDTVMAGAARFGVVGAFLEEHRSHSIGHPADIPLPAQTQTEHHAVIGATMVQTGYGEREGQAPRALDVQAPVGTQVAGGAKHAVVGVFLEERRGQSVGQEPEAPLGSQTQGPHHSLVGAWMVQHNTGVVGHTMEESLSTMTTVGTQQQVAAAYLTELRGTSRDGQPVTDPAGTMCTGGGRGGGHHAPTAVYLHHQYSTGGMHQGVDVPLATQSTVDRTMVTGAELAPQLSPEKLARARQVADFLRAHGAWDEREFVTVGPWLVVDIGMRMLTPAEAAAAHELTMPKEIEIDGVRRPLTKTEAMRLVGNSVPKRMARLLAEANAVHTLYAPSRQLQAAE